MGTELRPRHNSGDFSFSPNGQTEVIARGGGVEAQIQIRIVSQPSLSIIYKGLDLLRTRIELHVLPCSGPYALPSTPGTVELPFPTLDKVSSMHLSLQITVRIRSRAKIQLLVY
jgi:hypothetical protein